MTSLTPPGQRVFVTGHSFHTFVAEGLASLAESAGIRGHELVGRQMIGASRVLEHWDLPDGQNDAKAALVAGRVDVLTMSHNWSIPDEGIALFAALGIEYNPELRILLQISWHAFDHWEPVDDPSLWNVALKITDNSERDSRLLDNLRASNVAVRKIVVQQITGINKAHRREVIRVVPVADAVLRLRERVMTGKVPGIGRPSELFSDAIGHGTAPVLALVTYCNFSCIYGCSPVGLDDGNRELDLLAPELRSTLQRIAWNSVISEPLSGVSGRV
jgi:hypothetical protein